MNLLEYAHSILNIRLMPSVVLLWYKTGHREEIGSGFFVQMGDQYFIFTCHHVLDAFIKSRERLVLTGFGRKESLKIPFSAIADYRLTDHKLDVAWARLKSVPSSVSCFTLDDIKELNSTADIKPKSDTMLVAGYPAGFSEVNESKRSFALFSVWAEPKYPPCEPKDTLICCKYPPEGSIGDNEEWYVSDSRISPKAGGLSGSPIWLVPDKPEKIWSPTDAKIIGITHTWNFKQHFIKGTLIKHIMSILP